MSDPDTWSPSHSWLWQTCPRQFLLARVLDTQPAQPEAIRRPRGRVLHAGMEAAMRAASMRRSFEAGSMFDFIPEARQAMETHRDAARLSVPERVDCVRTVAATLATLQTPAPDSILGVEFGFSLPYMGFQVNGVIDVVFRTGPQSIKILDWKSGKVPDSSLMLEGDIPLMIYSVAALRAWPWVRGIEVCLYSLSQRRAVSLKVTGDMQMQALDRIARDFRAAQRARTTLSPETVDREFPARSGEHCATCVFRSYCPEFAGAAPLPLRSDVDVPAERARIAAALAPVRSNFSANL